MKNNKAFTLLELLVVVLIIGILVAIAVPKYQKTVFKSRSSQVISLVRSLGNAQEIYFLNHGEYADTFEKLDVSLPNGLENCEYRGFPCKQYKKFKIFLYQENDRPADSVDALYYYDDNNYARIIYYLYNERKESPIREAADLICLGSMCKLLGGTLIEGYYYKL